MYLYLQRLSESARTKAPIEEAVHAISWVQLVVGQPQASASPVIKSIIAGFQRRLAQPRTPKKPISPQMLLDMVQRAGSTPSLTTIRTLATCPLAFGGFLRSDELIELCCSDVTFVAEGLVLSIRSSKTNQLREGDSVVIAKTGKPTGPVEINKILGVGPDRSMLS